MMLILDNNNHHLDNGGGGDDGVGSDTVNPSSSEYVPRISLT